MKKEAFKKLTPNRAVNIFFGDGSNEEKRRLFAEKQVSAESLFLGLVREIEASLATGYDIPLEYTRAFFPDFKPTAAFLKLVFNR
jgi:hypothetical protein